MIFIKIIYNYRIKLLNKISIPFFSQGSQPFEQNELKTDAEQSEGNDYFFRIPNPDGLCPTANTMPVNGQPSAIPCVGHELRLKHGLFVTLDIEKSQFLFKTENFDRMEASSDRQTKLFFNTHRNVLEQMKVK